MYHHILGIYRITNATGRTDIPTIQFPVLGLGLGIDFTFANNNSNNNKNPHLNFLIRNGTMGMKFGTQT